jgi:hypothetical protein
LKIIPCSVKIFPCSVAQGILRTYILDLPTAASHPEIRQASAGLMGVRM